VFAVCVRHLLYHYSAALGDYSDLYVVGRDEHKVRAEITFGNEFVFLRNSYESS